MVQKVNYNQTHRFHKRSRARANDWLLTVFLLYSINVAIHYINALFFSLDILCPRIFCGHTSM